MTHTNLVEVISICTSSERVMRVLFCVCAISYCSFFLVSRNSNRMKDQSNVVCMLLASLFASQIRFVKCFSVFSFFSACMEWNLGALTCGRCGKSCLMRTIPSNATHWSTCCENGNKFGRKYFISFFIEMELIRVLTYCSEKSVINWINLLLVDQRSKVKILFRRLLV